MNAIVQHPVTAQQQGPWTPERVERLKAMWAAGKSASVCAAALGGGISRNGVIGKVHRMGLERRGVSRSATAGGRPRKRKPTDPTNRSPSGDEDSMPIHTRRRSRLQAPNLAPVRDLPRSEVWNPLPGVQPVTQKALGLATCRWPVEDGKPRFGLDRLFCGDATRPGDPYCPTHAVTTLNCGVSTC